MNPVTAWIYPHGYAKLASEKFQKVSEENK
jgi:hypothetical protein